MAIIATKSGWFSLGALVDETDETWTLYVDEQRRNRTIRKDDVHVQVFSSVEEAEQWVLFNHQPIARLRA
jgi:hypothetical protein